MSPKLPNYFYYMYNHYGMTGQDNYMFSCFGTNELEASNEHTDEMVSFLDRHNSVEVSKMGTEGLHNSDC